MKYEDFLSLSQYGSEERHGVLVSPHLEYLPDISVGPPADRQIGRDLQVARDLTWAPKVGVLCLNFCKLDRTPGAQGILIAVSYFGGPYLFTKTQLYPSSHKLHCWKPQVKQLVRQGHSPKQ